MTDLSYPLKNPSLTIGTECVMFIFSLLGLFANGLALYIAIFRLKLRTASIGLMVVIAISDVILALMILINEISKYATNHLILKDQLFCNFVGMVSMLLPMTSIDGVALLSLLRALSIVLNIEIKSIYWYTTMGLMITYNIVINIIGFSHRIMTIMPSEVYCHSRFQAHTFSELFMYLLFPKFLIMVAIIMASYILITIKVYKTFSQLNSRKNSSRDYFVNDNPPTSYQIRLIFKLVILLLMYMICFFPELAAVAYTVIAKKPRSELADAISGTTISFSLLVNSIFVLFYQKEARDILISMFPSWLYSHKPIIESTELDNFQI